MAYMSNISDGNNYNGLRSMNNMNELTSMNVVNNEQGREMS